MKRVIAMFAVFALAAALAVYFALAPNGIAPLDDLALKADAVHGRGTAVIGMLVAGLVLAFLVGLLAGEREPALEQAGGPQRRWLRKERDELDTPPAPAWSPEPLSEDRIVDLRRRAASTAEEEGRLFAPDAADEAATARTDTPPVVLLRKPRERGRDWFGDTSWLGGLPRLGDAPWPRDERGAPLPFAAQIDLADLAAACPHTPLAQSGALAFFLGSGAVVGVPGSPADFTDPPQDLPPAYDEGGALFPPRASRLSRHFFPFWPVEPLAPTVPDDLQTRSSAEREAALRRALAARLPALASARQRPFHAEDRESATLWWHSAGLLADQLDAAYAAAAAPLAERRDALHARQHAASRMLSDPEVGIAEMDAAEAEIHALEDELTHLEAQRPALADMVQALDHFVAGRQPWEPLSPEEQAILGEILEETRASYGDLTAGHAATSLSELATASLRAMVSGPPDALAALPEDVLDRINREHRLPPRAQHRMFGPDMGGDMLLLLQLSPDDLVEWRWDEARVFRFRIARKDAAAGNWGAATLSFEDA